MGTCSWTEWLPPPLHYMGTEKWNFPSQLLSCLGNHISLAFESWLLKIHIFFLILFRTGKFLPESYKSGLNHYSMDIEMKTCVVWTTSTLLSRLEDWYPFSSLYFGLHWVTRDSKVKHTPSFSLVSYRSARKRTVQTSDTLPFNPGTFPRSEQSHST